MYPEEMVLPMKHELTKNGFEDVTTSEQAEALIGNAGTVFVVINSVCGCSAGSARPAALEASKHSKVPTKLLTAFAGFDNEAVNKIREHMLPFPPSSPSMALFKDGKLVHCLERHHIEGVSSEAISENLKAAFDEYC